jgi:hypothetical protein
LQRERGGLAATRCCRALPPRACRSRARVHSQTVPCYSVIVLRPHAPRLGAQRGPRPACAAAALAVLGSSDTAARSQANRQACAHAWSHTAAGVRQTRPVLSRGADDVCGTAPRASERARGRGAPGGR